MKHVAASLLCIAGAVVGARGQLFSDNFTRGTDPGPLTPWVAQAGNWTVTGGVLKGGTNTPFSYGNVYITNTWANYSVQAQFQFPVGAFGGGLGAYLNPASGAHYAAWIYPENSVGGSNVLKLLKFQNWTSFGYNNVSGSPMQVANLSGVGTNWHTLQMTLQANQITVYYDSNQVMTVTDAEAVPYTSGGVSLDMWTDAAAYVMSVDNVLVNPAPLTANNDTYTVKTGKLLSIAAPGVLTNDTGGSGPLRALLASSPTHGTFSLNTNGGFTYTATNTYTGTDAFTYRATDGVTTSAVATATITVTTNHPPLANNDNYIVAASTALTVAAPGVLANDTDADGDSLTAVLVTGTAHGTLNLNTNGGFTYTPTNNFTGTDTFTYQANDGQANSGSATVSISVLPPGVLFSDDFTRSTDPGPLSPWIAQSGFWTVSGGAFIGGPNGPSSYGDAYITNSWTNYSVQASIRFSTANAWGGGIGGCLAPATGAHYSAWIYPEGSANGSNVVRLFKFQTWTSFGYLGTGFVAMAQASLPGVGTNWHTVQMSFQANQIAVYYDTNQVLNVTDAEAAPYSGGAVSVDTYSDATGYNFLVDNVLVTTLPLTANNDSYTVKIGRTLTVAAPGVLANDVGGKGPLRALLASAPAHGTFNLNTNGGFTYTPTNNYNGTDTFTYKATDGQSTSTVATATITVTPNHAPVANNDSYAVIANTLLTVAAPGVLANDTDADGDALTAALVIGPTNGTLSLNTNGGFTYTPATNYNGTDSFTYQANDGQTNSSIATVTLSVMPPGILFADNFTRGTDPGPLAPWVAQAGAWTVTGGALVAGPNALTSYGDAYVANTWTNYSVQGRIHFSTTNAFGGGLGGRVNAGTGAHYAAWVYPEGSTGGSNVLKLIKFQTWTSFGYNGVSSVPMQTASLPGVGTNWHTVEMAFFSNRIAVYYDGTQFISVTDTEASPYLAGGISADMWTDSSAYTMSVDDVTVSLLVINDSYTVNQDTALTVPAPGVLANDTAVFTPNLTAVAAVGPTNGTLNLSTNGGFTYTPNGGYSGPDSFTYQANDGGTSLGTGTVSITVLSTGPMQLLFYQNFDGVVAPALPTGWTTSTTTGQSAWVTKNSTTNNTTPNAAFAFESANVGLSDLVSPPITLPSGSAQLTFQNFCDLEYDTAHPVTNFDSGVLEIKIGTNAFTDILAAGGVFLTGGYDGINSSAYNNPLPGRLSWSGPASGFTKTTVDLPPAAAGQTIQLRWRCGTDQGTSGTYAGWYVDSIAISNCTCACCWNTPPVLPVQTNQTVNELTQLVVTNTATDADLPTQTLTYTLLTKPSAATVDTSGVIRWTPQQTNSPSTNTFTMKVADNGSPALSVTNSFSVIVREVNVAPVLSNISTQTVNELALLTVTNTATESNIHSTLGYMLVNPPAGASINTNGLVTWVPPQTLSPGTNTITTIVTNTNPYDLVNPHLSATNSFTVIVREVNVAPGLPVIPAQTVNELTLLTVTNTATNANIHSTIAGYALLNPLTGMSIDANSVFTWTPTQLQSPATNTVTTVVTNANPYDLIHPQLMATNTFTIIVREFNVAPVLPVIPPQTVSELTLLTVTNSATNANIHSTITGYALVNPLAGMSIAANGIFTWTPAQTQSPGTNIVTTIVTNANPYDLVNPRLTATNTFTVIVQEVNVAPGLPVIPTQTVNELTLLTVTNTATNANIHSTITSYTLLNPLVGMNIDANGVFTWTPSQSQSPGTYAITTIVTNNNPFDLVNPHLTATSTFTVIVQEVNVAPRLPVIPDQTINELTLLTVTNTATNPNIHSTIVGYGLLAALPGMTIDANGVFSWTPAQTQSPGTNIVTTVVTNTNPFDLVNPQLTATNSFTVIVREVNVPPSLPGIPDQTINELTLLTVANTATNANIHSTVVGYGLLAPLPGMTIDANGVFTWTPAQTQSPGTNIVTTVVTNTNPFDLVNPQLTATNSFTVIVREVNVPPSLPVIPDQTINELTLLTVANTATNANIHATVAGYSLVTPPDGMSIDAGGIITWTPSHAQSGSTNQITTVVTNSDLFDLVNPSLSATNTFVVVVNPSSTVPAPTILSIGLSNGVATITWSAVSGNNYRLQYTDTLLPAAWFDVVPDVLATGPTATASNEVGTADQRFYRVLLSPQVLSRP